MLDGAPVVFRGVRLGSVTSIGLAYDKSKDTFSIPVMAEDLSVSLPAGETLLARLRDQTQDGGGVVARAEIDGAHWGTTDCRRLGGGLVLLAQDPHRLAALVARGAVDDQYGLGYALDAPKNNYLRDAKNAGHYSQIFDSNYMTQAAGWPGKLVPPEDLKDYMPDEPGLKKGVFESFVNTHKADTLQELAKKIKATDKQIKNVPLVVP